MVIQQRRHHILKRIAYSAAALLIVAFSFPPVALADDVPLNDSSTTTTTSEPTAPAPEPTTTTTSEPVSTTSEPTTTDTTSTTTTQGPQTPTGADADTYTYNETTGLWENSKYTWDPVTKQTSPKTAPTYSYNPETGHWDTTQWIYDAPSGTYVPNVISVASPPDGALISPNSPAVPSSLEADTSSGIQRLSSSSSNTGTDSNSITKDDTSSSGIFDRFYNALISNHISSSAISGDAITSMNTLAGNAMSGDAKAIATIFNLLSSTWGAGLLGAFTTFTQSIFGNIVGDLLLNPGQPQVSGVTSSPTDVTMNSSGNTAIDNKITLEATSGDATVTKNTTAGDATTGSATAIANIINAINSSIVAGQSFVGMLNIYGSLNGDILLPTDLINTLLASNTVGTLDTSNISNADVLGNFNNNSSITNTVTATATSGDATVDKNTSAGNATSGDASTNITLLNLTGRQVVGKDALLVFVNVMGKWVGMIVNAPSGSTSAALGGGITSDSTLAVNSSTDQAINNTIDASATSGNALVSQNTKAGNATSGDAHTAVNILNMNNSQFALSDWFGVLFINVFGSWTGSFGIDTPAGSVPIGSSSSSGLTPTVAVHDIKAFKFVPHNNGSYTLESSNDGGAALVSAGVLSSSTASPSDNDKKAPQTASEAKKSADWMTALVGVSIAASLLGTERVLNRRQSK